MNVAALIFDFDGLILETETPIFEEWSAVYRRHGHLLALDLWQHSIGTKGGFDPCAHLMALTGEALDREALEREVHERFWRRCEEQTLLPGVEAVLRDARRLGLGTAVATSSGSGWAAGWLERHGIRGHFDVLCVREDVPRVKPAPDLFLLAAERLGVRPDACVVFEDSPNGIHAAHAAGMRCVAVPNNVTRSLPLPDPDLVLGSLAELPLAAILARLEVAKPLAAS
jgi:HAD superfamily hydrolase (TIGR01509 family)